VSPMLPGVCALCGNCGRGAVCETCRMLYLKLEVRRCRCCAIAMADETAMQCGGCLKSPPAFDTTIAVTDYAPPLDEIVLALKFKAQLALAPVVSNLLLDATLCRAEDELPQLLCAVPLSAARLAERGFNQALEIAKPLSNAIGVPLEARLLLRVRETGAQSLLSPDERRRNVRGAFAVSPSLFGRIHDRHVGVVDDVMTTGETLNEVAATLKRFGARRVTNFIFARTPPK
ncbi:MAG: ComF family protein, partial [Paucimonas sp.]|nr:ComF family protein [Paucimonas sp.]